MSDIMSRETRRKRRKGVTIAATAVAIASPLIMFGVAQAQTTPDLIADCLANSVALQTCDYLEVNSAPNQLGAPQRVSTVLNNCDSPVAANKAFEWSVTVSRSVETEKGRTSGLGATAENSMGGVVTKHNGGTLKIAGGTEGITASNKISGDIQPAREGFIMFQSKSLVSLGYVHGVYKEAINGQREFDAPAAGSGGIKVFFPQLVAGGIPDGRIWLRNAPCGVSAAGGGDVATAGFGEIDGIIDTELALPS
jgi:hypothetical protein